MENSIACTSCNSGVHHHDNFCANCGSSLDFNKRDKSQTLVFAAVAVLFGSALYWFFIDIIATLSGHYEIYDATEWFGNTIALAASSAALLAALSMKKGRFKTLALVFAAIYTMIQLYWLIRRIFPDAPLVNFEF